MTVNLNEIASLVQQLQSYMNDSNMNIISVSIGKTSNYIHVNHVTFLSNFTEFEIELIEDEEPYCEMDANIEGVPFIALINFAEIVDLEESMPDQWEYTQQKVQVEAL